MPNSNRCKTCNQFGGTDGYCNKHRPVFSIPELDHRTKHHIDPYRKNFKEFGWGFDKIEEKKEFGILKDFGINRKWGGQ